MSLTTDTPGNQPSAADGRSRFIAGSRLSGELHVPGVVELLGHVDGQVHADAIVIEDGGSVHGELHAADITIRGELEGKIFGGAVKLNASARVSGEIAYETLSIESGAQINATCTLKTPGGA
jgi:cytoskeletal protein CcmA (bactofilin family)